jgi:hypothetical protein
MIFFAEENNLNVHTHKLHNIKKSMMENSFLKFTMHLKFVENI